MEIKKTKRVSVKDLNGRDWIYSQEVEDNFFTPKNVMKDEQGFAEKGYNGVGEIGSPACGDLMRVWLKIDPKSDKILDFKWKTFGCASAIASTSVLSQIVIGMTTEEAYIITPQDIVRALGGLPKRKIHCSVLGDQALRAAIEDYRKNKK